MKAKQTYSDADVIASLAQTVHKGRSYRATAELLGVDRAVLHKVVNGKWKLPEKMAQAAGFILMPQPNRTWKRKAK